MKHQCSGLFIFDRVDTVVNICGLHLQIASDLLIVSWIDDNLIVGAKAGIAEVKGKLMKCFDCKDCGDLDAYVGLKLERDSKGVCGGLKMY